MLVWGARAAALGAVGVTLYLTLSPSPTGSGLLPPWAGHLGVFAGVGASFALLRRASRWSDARFHALAFAVVFLSAATETGQSFTGRHPDVVDLAVDLAAGLGGLLGVDAMLSRRLRD